MAELAWQLRPWVTTAAGRAAKLGMALEYKRCDEETRLPTASGAQR